MLNKIKINFLLCVWVTIFLGGCANVPLSHKYNIMIFNAKNKAVVVIKIFQHYTTLFNQQDKLMVEFNLVRLDDNYNDPDKRTFYKINSENDQIVMLKPGIYFIDHLEWHDGLYVHKSKFTGITKDNAILYGAFEVKPGDVGYIGDLVIPDDNAIILNRVKKLAKTKEYLIQNKYNDLSSMIKEIKFYDKGSKIRKNSDGLFVIY